MKTIIYRPAKDDEFGLIGLMPEGHSMQESYLNASCEPFALAHDVIEHVNGYGRIGDVSDELEAMGALWWTRGQYGDIRRTTYGNMLSPQDAVALNIVSLFRDCIDGNKDHEAVANRAGDAEDDFVQIVDQMRHYVHGETYNFKLGALDDFAISALTRMRAGYRKARKRYGDQANRLFWSIADVMTPHMKNLELYGPHIKLTYGITNGRGFARAEEFYHDDGY